MFCRICPLLFSLVVVTLSAQSAKKLLREGNAAYLGKKDYKQAEQLYKKALAVDNKYGKASYNLGAAYFKQGKYDEAAAQFEGIKSFTKDKDTVFRSMHNQGTAYLKSKKYDEAIKALKAAVKKNPKDEDTRYNLAYAMYQKRKEDQKKKDQKQDKSKQNENPKPQKQEQKPQAQISKKEAERMLKALQNEEKKIQRAKRKKQEKSGENFSGKDW